MLAFWASPLPAPRSVHAQSMQWNRSTVATSHTLVHPAPPHTAPTSPIARRHWSLLILPVRSPCYGHAELPQRMCHMAGEDNVSSATVLCSSSHTCCARTHPHTQHYHVKTARHSRWEHAREHQNCIRSPWAFSPCRASCCHASEQLDVCLWSAVTTIMPRQKAPAMRDTINPPPPPPPHAAARLRAVHHAVPCLAPAARVTGAPSVAT